jgi:hypothetical protein
MSIVPEKSARRVMTQVETIKMHSIMQQHIRIVPMPDGETSQCEYIDDWSDQRVAQATAPDLHEGHASRLRLNFWGPLFEPKNPDKELEKRLSTLEQSLANLLVLFDNLATKHDRLCQGLSVARVVDARHLVTGDKP